MDSSVFHEDNIQFVAINIVEENIFHLSSLFFHDSSIKYASVWKSDPLHVLEEGSKLGVVAFALLGYMLLMYSYMITSTDFHSCTENGGNLHSLGVDITYYGSKLKFQVFFQEFGFVVTLVGSLCKFEWLQDLLTLIVEKIKHIFWENDPLLPKKKIPPDIFI